MVVRAIGAGLLARLIGGERGDIPDTSWLMFGPTDAEVVETDEPEEPLLLAAE